MVLCVIMLLIGITYNRSHSFSSLNQDQHLIQGIKHVEGTKKKPEALNSLKSFLKSYKEGNEDGLLHVIHLYLFGLHPEYGPDKITGLKLINRIHIDRHFSDNMKQVCHVLLEDVVSQVYDDADLNMNYKRLPTDISDTLDDIVSYQMTNNIKVTKCSMNSSHKTIKVPKKRIMGNTPPDTQTGGGRYSPNAAVTNARRRLGEYALEDVVIVHNDSQNVHNHSVQNISMNIIDKMDSNSLSFEENSHTFLEQLKGFSGSLSKNEINDVGIVVNTLTDNNHSKYDKSEKDIFNMTLERISNKKDVEEKNNLSLMLAQNLASAMEHDVVVCSTGKITRMLSTFDVIDSELPDLKPDWMIREEIATKAGKIREDVLSECSLIESTEYNENSSDSPLAEKMRTKLKDECTKDYINNTKIMSQLALDILLVDYLVAF